MPGFRRLHFLSAVLALFAAAAGHADPPDSAAFAAAERAFAADLARTRGLDADEIMATLAAAQYQQSIIDAMTRPAEAKPWKDYRPIFLTEARIADGVAFVRDNAALLQRVEREYGVPPRIIAAIVGVETNYGKRSGRYRVLDALATLAFAYPPRQEFFRAELGELFALRGPAFPYPLDELTGSYAGAMGWGQFMPSSIAKFARDDDGDGKVDLWNSLPDICASVANYFLAHGWQKDGTIAVRARVDAGAKPPPAAGVEPVYALGQLAARGYHAGSGLDPMKPATLLVLDGADGPEAWITFENFYVISRYNHSPLYSMAVFQLSEAIGAGATAP